MDKQIATTLNDIYDAWRMQDLDWLGSYLPDDFTHVMHFPAKLHPWAGVCRGKQAVMARWQVYIAQYEFLSFDTSSMIVERSRAAVEIPLRYRHRQTGDELALTKANFWAIEAGWPVKLTEYYDVRTLSVFFTSLREDARLMHTAQARS